MNFAVRVHQNSTPSNAAFSAHHSHEGTEFGFILREGIDWECASASSRIFFARDGIEFRSIGPQIHLTISHNRMREIFAEILNRKVFSPVVFEPHVACLSDSVERVASILRRLLAKFEGGKVGDLLPDAMLHNLARLVAHVWPSTNSQELSLPPDQELPIALRLALDYIYSRRGLVKSVVEVASVTNVGLRTLETVFREKMSVGVRRYCKYVLLRRISEELESGYRTINQIALEFGISNVSRLRWEIGEYSSDAMHYVYPWEIYQTIQAQISGIEPPRLCRRPRLVRCRPHDT